MSVTSILFEELDDLRSLTSYTPRKGRNLLMMYANSEQHDTKDCIKSDLRIIV